MEGREKDLASVGMSGENQIDMAPGSVVCEVGLVRQQNQWFEVGIPAGGKSGGQVGLLHERILGAGEPDTLAVALEGYEVIRQHRNIMCEQGIGDRRVS